MLELRGSDDLSGRRDGRDAGLKSGFQRTRHRRSRGLARQPARGESARDRRSLAVPRRGRPRHCATRRDRAAPAGARIRVRSRPSRLVSTARRTGGPACSTGAQRRRPSPSTAVSARWRRRVPRRCASNTGRPRDVRAAGTVEPPGMPQSGRAQTIMSSRRHGSVPRHRLLIARSTCQRGRQSAGPGPCRIQLEGCASCGCGRASTSHRAPAPQTDAAGGDVRDRSGVGRWRTEVPGVVKPHPPVASASASIKQPVSGSSTCCQGRIAAGFRIRTAVDRENARIMSGSKRSVAQSPPPITLPARTVATPVTASAGSFANRTQSPSQRRPCCCCRGRNRRAVAFREGVPDSSFS